MNMYGRLQLHAWRGQLFGVEGSMAGSSSNSMAWKCPNPDGTVGTLYKIKRRMDGPTAAFVYIGATGVKQFIDESLPPGPTRVTNQITAIRSTRAGHPAQFTINLGVEGNGQRRGLTITHEAA